MKSKIIISMLVLLCTYSVASAQSNEVKKLEFELGGGVVYPNLSDGIPGAIGFQLHGEARYNLTSSFDVALQYSFNKFDRDDLLSRKYHNFKTSTISAFFDYSWRPAKNINVFVGLGVGCSLVEDHLYHINKPDGIDDTENHTLFALTPRFGVELFNRVRLTIDYKLNKTEYSYLGLSVGFTFGGGYK